jgi:hypothetical protein
MPTPSISLFALLARAARTAVVFRRGPSKQVALIKWNLSDDTFEVGQWLKGRVYERRSDLSPSGSRLIYFAGNWKPPLRTWTAVSRPPYLTALALWPKGDTWGGGGLFESEDVIALHHGANEQKLAEGFQLPGHLVVKPFISRSVEDPLDDARMRRDGWMLVDPGVWRRGHDARFFVEVDPPQVYEKPRPGSAGMISLRRILRAIHERNGSWYALDHQLTWEKPKGEIELPRTDWADWDSNGDLLFARGGKLFRARPRKRLSEGLAELRELADFSSLRFQERVAPNAARRWG